MVGRVPRMSRMQGCGCRGCGLADAVAAGAAVDRSVTVRERPAPADRDAHTAVEGPLAIGMRRFATKTHELRPHWRVRRTSLAARRSAPDGATRRGTRRQLEEAAGRGDALLAEFFCLRPASRRRLSLFGEPEGLPPWRTLLRAWRNGSAQARVGTRSSRAFAGIPRRQDRRSLQAPARSPLHRASETWPSTRRPIGRASGSNPKSRRRISRRSACEFDAIETAGGANWLDASARIRRSRRQAVGRPDRRSGGRLSRQPGSRTSTASSWRKSRNGCWCSLPAFFRWSVRSSARARAPAGLAWPIA